jgi:hypothetical protein
MACALAWVIATQETPVVWGGEHIEMEIGRTTARIELDCAHGTIDEPVRPDAKGAFKVKGTFTPERGGPTVEGETPAPKATYSGAITDDTMTLRIVVQGQDEHGITYELTRDRRGNVRKCR